MFTSVGIRRWRIGAACLGALLLIGLFSPALGQDDSDYASVSPYTVDAQADSVPAPPPAASPVPTPPATPAMAADALRELPDAHAQGRPDPPPPRSDPRALGAADLERGVSAFGDPIRFARTLPGAGRGNDWETELSVRGGSPDQTGFLVDGMSLARVSHYEGMHGEHGGIGILNLAFADSVHFHPGTFPARFPDRLSGLVEVDYRDGDADAAHAGILTDVTGAGGTAEGPLPGGRGSYAAAARYSAMDLLIRSGVVRAYGVPVYFNGQARVTVPVGAAALRARIIGGGENWSNRIGAVSTLDMQGHSLASALSLESADGRGRADLRYEERAQRLAFASWGRRQGAGGDSMTRLEDGRERRWGLAAEHSFSPGAGWTFGAGASGEAALGAYRIRYGDEATYLPRSDTVIQFTQDVSAGEALLANGAAFAEGTWTAGKAELYAGYRHLYERASEQQAFQPRLSATFRPAPGQALRAAFGLHSQPHDYGDLAARPDRLGARLPYMAQAEAGWEWETRRRLSLSLDLFAKEGYRLARRAIVPAGPGFLQTYRDTGRTRARGLEAAFRTPRTGRWDATLAYAYLWYRERDAAGRWRPGPYSLPHNFNVAAGAALTRGLWLTGRFSAGSGTPYTPFDSAASMRAGTGVYDPSRAYARRGPAYFRLDARLDWTGSIKGARVGLFAEIENVFDRRNESGREWNLLDGKEAPVEGMGRLPVAGASIRF